MGMEERKVGGGEQLYLQNHTMENNNNKKSMHKNKYAIDELKIKQRR